MLAFAFFSQYIPLGTSSRLTRLPITNPLPDFSDSQLEGLSRIQTIIATFLKGPQRGNLRRHRHLLVFWLRKDAESAKL